MLKQTHALVLFSGGQDSTACLAWALSEFEHVETVGFDYGQTHSVELACRSRLLDWFRQGRWRGTLGQDRILSATALTNINRTSLTGDLEIGTGSNGLPTTFVPGRNLLFVVLAAAVAYGREIRNLVTGVCETDYSGYPDCRDNTMKAAQLAINSGMDANFVIHTPLMWKNKADTWALAESLGGEALIDATLELSHTCYRGDRSKRHSWGYGCGTCPACTIREQGFHRYIAHKQSTSGVSRAA